MSVENIIATVLGLLALVVFVIFMIWRSKAHKEALRQLTEEFQAEETEYE